MRAYCDSCIDIVNVTTRQRVTGDQPTCARCDSASLSVPMHVHMDLVDGVDRVVERARKVIAEPHELMVGVAMSWVANDLDDLLRDVLEEHE